MSIITMGETSISFKTRKEIKLREPAKYEVIFHNDDFTPMDFVVELLVKVFRKSESDALTLMLTVHHEESAVVGVYTYDIARSKTDKAISMAREQGYPLEITIECVDKDDIPF